jgi:membrane protease YdiL (CAAX protease family)
MRPGALRSHGHPASGATAWLILWLLLAGTVVRVLLHPWLEAPWNGDYVAKRLVADAWKILLFVALPLAPALLIEGRSLRHPTGLPPGPRPVAALVLAGAWTLGVVLVDRWAGRQYPFWPAGMARPHLALGLVSTLLAAVSEEFAFRGMLLPRLVARCGWSFGQGLTALAFGLVHLPGWILLDRADPLGALAVAAQIVLFGAALGLVTLWSGRLAPAIVLHFLNNLAAGPAFR